MDNGIITITGSLLSRNGYLDGLGFNPENEQETRNALATYFGMLLHESLTEFPEQMRANGATDDDMRLINALSAGIVGFGAGAEGVAVVGNRNIVIRSFNEDLERGEDPTVAMRTTVASTIVTKSAAGWFMLPGFSRSDLGPEEVPLYENDSGQLASKRKEACDADVWPEGVGKTHSVTLAGWCPLGERTVIVMRARWNMAEMRPEGLPVIVEEHSGDALVDDFYSIVRDGFTLGDVAIASGELRPLF